MTANEARGWSTPEAALAWQRSAEQRNRMLARATERMFTLAAISPGMRVLDIGTGSGDTAVMAEGRVGAAGTVIATDPSPAMVQAATEAVKTLGLTQVTVRAMDGGAIDLPEGDVDAIIARKSLMFLSDIPLALEGMRRVLRSGGRLSAVVWSSLANNPFHRALLDAARANGGLPAATPEIVRAFACTDAEEWRRMLASAGFREVVVEAVGSTRAYASAADAIERSKDSPVYTEVLSALSASARERALAQIAETLRGYEGPDGCAVPMESLVLAGSK